MRWVRIAIAGAIVASLVTAAIIGSAVRAQTSTAPAAVEVRHELHRDVSPAIQHMLPTPPTRKNGPAPRELELPRVGVTGLRDPVIQRQGSATLAAPTAGAGFEGLGKGLGGSIVNSAPPDTNGDVGPNSYVEIVNTAVRRLLRRRAPSSTGRSTPTRSGSGFGGGCQTNNDGDATVEVRPARQPVGDQPVLDRDDAVPPVRRRLDDRESRPARTTATRSATGARTSPTTRSSASGRTPTTRPTTSSAAEPVHRRQGVRVRPRAHAGRPGRDAAVLRHALGSMAVCCRPTSTGRHRRPQGRRTTS